LTTIETDFDAAQRLALEASAKDGGVAIVGPPGSGKTRVLLARAHAEVSTSDARALIASPVHAALDRMRARIAHASLSCATPAELAFAILRDQRKHDGDVRPLELVTEARASHRFEAVGAELFALEWTEFAAAELDPEITGLRAPERFAATAFRLIRKLRAALVSPADFKAHGLRGATEFYAHPPNFANADLLAETPTKYADSLRVSTSELERQRTREVDLVKILARLYASYALDVETTGELTGADAVYEATHLVRARPDVRDRTRERYPHAFIDDAQDLTDGDVALFAAIYGEQYANVTIAGDEDQRVRGFGGGARLGAFKHATATIALAGSYRTTASIANAARIALGRPDASPPGVRLFEGVTLNRLDSQREEARFVASEIARTIARGVAPERIALVVRNVACAHPYIDAILARGIPVDPAGKANLYEFPAVLDALAALWAAVDPYRHDFLLRNLEAPWLHLSDASIAVLCAEPTIPQPVLFELPGDDDDAGPRWDRKRDLRLGRNVTRGDADTSLSEDARERIVRFRTAMERWSRAARRLDTPELARFVLADTSLATAPSDARGTFERGLIERLLAAIDAFCARSPLATLHDVLLHAERIASAEGDLLTISVHDRKAVVVCDVENLAGASFDSVFIVDARAGAWPRYYVPDAFLFTPKYGMIPKDNVGDADAARTAKFTWAFGRFKYRSAYNDEDRRAFYLAATRAERSLCVTSWGRATSGKNTPELLSELERARDLMRS
jgi:superfamily I DNA/RNA helicase